MDEETAVRRFRALVAEWRLGTMEAALLLGVDGERLGLDLVPRAPSRDAVRRMSLLVTVRDRLPTVVAAGEETGRFLRTMDANDVSPILFLSHGCVHLRAFIDALEVRAERAARDGPGGWPNDSIN